MIIYYGRNLPKTGKAVAMSSLKMTMIAGSIAAEIRVPSHFHFSTMAQNDKMMHLRMKIPQFIPCIHGKFGGNQEKNWSLAFEMINKGGMDDEEFKNMELMHWFLCFQIPKMFLEKETFSRSAVALVV